MKRKFKVLLVIFILFFISINIFATTYNIPGSDGVNYKVSIDDTNLIVEFLNINMRTTNMAMYLAVDYKTGGSNSYNSFQWLRGSTVNFPFYADRIYFAKYVSGTTEKYFDAYTSSWGGSASSASVSLGNPNSTITVPLSEFSGTDYLNITMYIKDLASDNGWGWLYGSVAGSVSEGTGTKTIRSTGKLHYDMYSLNYPTFDIEIKELGTTLDSFKDLTNDGATYLEDIKSSAIDIGKDAQAEITITGDLLQDRLLYKFVKMENTTKPSYKVNDGGWAKVGNVNKIAASTGLGYETGQLNVDVYSYDRFNSSLDGFLTGKGSDYDMSSYTWLFYANKVGTTTKKDAEIEEYPSILNYGASGITDSQKETSNGPRNAFFNCLPGASPYLYDEYRYAMGMKQSGYITVPETGTYYFYSFMDDGAKVWVNGTQVIDNFENGGTRWNFQNFNGASNSAYYSSSHAVRSVYLQKDKYYSYRSEFFSNEASACFRLYWTNKTMSSSDYKFYGYNGSGSSNFFNKVELVPKEYFSAGQATVNYPASTPDLSATLDFPDESGYYYLMLDIATEGTVDNSSTTLETDVTLNAIRRGVLYGPFLIQKPEIEILDPLDNAAFTINTSDLSKIDFSCRVKDEIFKIKSVLVEIFDKGTNTLRVSGIIPDGDISNTLSTWHNLTFSMNHSNLISGNYYDVKATATNNDGSISEDITTNVLFVLEPPVVTITDPIITNKVFKILGANLVVEADIKDELVDITQVQLIIRDASNNSIVINNTKTSAELFLSNVAGVSESISMNFTRSLLDFNKLYDVEVIVTNEHGLTGNATINDIQPLSDIKEIVQFGFSTLDGTPLAEVEVDKTKPDYIYETDKTIQVTVPYGTDLTALSPEITLNDEFATISNNSGTPATLINVDGDSDNEIRYTSNPVDFSDKDSNGMPDVVIYTVTAGDGTTVNYNVQLIIEAIDITAEITNPTLTDKLFVTDSADGSKIKIEGWANGTKYNLEDARIRVFNQNDNPSVDSYLRTGTYTGFNDSKFGINQIFEASFNKVDAINGDFVNGNYYDIYVRIKNKKGHILDIVMEDVKYDMRPSRLKKIVIKNDSLELRLRRMFESEQYENGFNNSLYPETLKSNLYYNKNTWDANDPYVIFNKTEAVKYSTYTYTPAGGSIFETNGSSLVLASEDWESSFKAQPGDVIYVEAYFAESHSKINSNSANTTYTNTTSISGGLIQPGTLKECWRAYWYNRSNPSESSPQICWEFEVDKNISVEGKQSVVIDLVNNDGIHFTEEIPSVELLEIDKTGPAKPTWSAVDIGINNGVSEENDAITNDSYGISAFSNGSEGIRAYKVVYTYDHSMSDRERVNLTDAPTTGNHNLDYKNGLNYEFYIPATKSINYISEIITRNVKNNEEHPDDGKYIYDVYAIDFAGNLSLAFATDKSEIYVDTIAPNVPQYTGIESNIGGDNGVCVKTVDGFTSGGTGSWVTTGLPDEFYSRDYRKNDIVKVHDDIYFKTVGEDFNLELNSIEEYDVSKINLSNVKTVVRGSSSPILNSSNFITGTANVSIIADKAVDIGGNIKRSDIYLGKNYTGSTTAPFGLDFDVSYMDVDVDATVIVPVYDMAGNYTSAEIFVKIDNTAPIAPVIKVFASEDITNSAGYNDVTDGSRYLEDLYNISGNMGTEAQFTTDSASYYIGVQGGLSGNVDIYTKINSGQVSVKEVSLLSEVTAENDKGGVTIYKDNGSFSDFESNGSITNGVLIPNQVNKIKAFVVDEAGWPSGVYTGTLGTVTKDSFTFAESTETKIILDNDINHPSNLLSEAFGSFKYVSGTTYKFDVDLSSVKDLVGLERCEVVQIGSEVVSDPSIYVGTINGYPTTEADNYEAISPSGNATFTFNVNIPNDSQLLGTRTNVELRVFDHFRNSKLFTVQFLIPKRSIELRSKISGEEGMREKTIDVKVVGEKEFEINAVKEQ